MMGQTYLILIKQKQIWNQNFIVTETVLQEVKVDLAKLHIIINKYNKQYYCVLNAYV